MSTREHWKQLYTTRPDESLSWFQPHPGRSLEFIRRSGCAMSAAIIDVGGGSSTLIDELYARGYRALTVLDVSAQALAAARQRLGAPAAEVCWIEADITVAVLPRHAFDLWHDRAVFHFLTDPHQRQAYVSILSRSLKPEGQVIMATFSENGPSECSGLPVMRYSPAALQAELGAEFELLEHDREQHKTPAGAVQEFTWCRFRRNPGPDSYGD